jgi:hypothetical protein
LTTASCGYLARTRAEGQIDGEIPGLGSRLKEKHRKNGTLPVFFVEGDVLRDRCGLLFLLMMSVLVPLSSHVVSLGSTNLCAWIQLSVIISLAKTINIFGINIYTALTPEGTYANDINVYADTV